MEEFAPTEAKNETREKFSNYVDLENEAIEDWEGDKMSLLYRALTKRITAGSLEA